MIDVLMPLVHASVSASVLILAVFATRFLFRRRLQPGLRYALWAIVAIKLLLPFSISWTLERDALPQAPAQEIAMPNGLAALETTRASGARIATDAERGFSLLDAFPVIWLSGTVFCLAFFLMQNRFFRRAIQKTRVPHSLPPGMEAQLCAAMGLKKAIPVYTAGAQISPCAMGVFRTSIVLTDAVTGDADTMKYALMHEMVHCKHKHNLARLLANVLCAVYWFHPLVWLAANAARDDAELFCDSVVLQKINRRERFDYGLALLSVAGNRCVATALSGGGKSVKERIDLIIHPPMGRRVSRAVVAMCLLLCLGSFVRVDVVAKSGAGEGPFALGQIYDVYQLTCALPAPNDNYRVNTYVINCSNHDKGGNSPAKSIWLRYELDYAQGSAEHNQCDEGVMADNARRLFEAIPELNAVTFSFIDKPINSNVRNETPPVSYQYHRGHAQPQTDRTFWQSYGENNIVMVYGHSDILAAAGLNADVFEESSAFAQRVLSVLASYDSAWAGQGCTVYCYSPNTVYRNWNDFLYYIDNEGRFEGHAIRLSSQMKARDDVG